MDNIKISIKLSKLPCFAISHKMGRKTFEMQAFDGEVSCDVQYDYHRAPLRLSAKVEENDVLEIILLPHRIELYVNGVLADEEWPAGNRLFSMGDEIRSDQKVCVEQYHELIKQEPCVISTFENAEGWRPGNGVYVGDCMPYKRGEEYHVLYLKDRRHHKSKWGLGAHQWEHISTKDFKTWAVHPMAIAITQPFEGSICTGSHICDGDKEYLYYTVRMGKGIAAPVLRSVSYDGYHFEKDDSFGFTISEKYLTARTRDPKVIKGEDGLYHMFLTTGLVKEGKGCLAHLVSVDLDHWEEMEEPIYIAPTQAQPECPDYFVYNGKYYLVFSLEGRAHYMLSDKPFEDFVMPEDPIIPCQTVPKCAPWKGRLIFTGFNMMEGYAGTMTFKAAKAKENGILVFEEL